ncbi:MAG: non-homologous end-joining DNA ligase [Fulvivirga sp.]
MKAGKREILVSHGSKLMFPEGNISKLAIAQYYKSVAKFMLPHLENRPLMLQRFPNGIHKKGFFQKEISAHFPDWISTVTVSKEGGEVKHVLCNNEATLIYLVNQSTISFHSWLSLKNAIDHPDKLIIDLDPASDDFDEVRKGAFLVKKFLEDLSITSFVMTTGSSGVHIVVPLDGQSDFDESREAAKEIADIQTEVHPNIFTTARYKKDREGKIYFDIQRNAYAQTAISPYSLRPLPEGPIATPVDWTELEDPALNARTWNINNFDQRIAEMNDPWKGMRRHAVSVRILLKRINKLVLNRA